MIAMTFSGFVMVFRTCQPFNVYRAVLCAGVLGIIVGCYCISPLADALLYKGWTEIVAEWSYDKVLIIVVVTEAAFPISGWLTDLSHVLFPSTSRKRAAKTKKQVTE